MKFSATLVSIALALAGSVQGHAHVKNMHRRGGPSATFVPTSTLAPATYVRFGSVIGLMS